MPAGSLHSHACGYYAREQANVRLEFWRLEGLLPIHGAVARKAGGAETNPLSRPEYPRPSLVREEWVNLNGEWEFGAGPAPTFDRSILVPFCPESTLSGLGELPGDVVWYRRRFDAPQAESLVLHFGAVDYRATVWVNDVEVARHEGGHVPFSADITGVVSGRDNVLVVRVEDPLHDLTIPRGKQYWKEIPEGIFYTPTTGIWQTVWLEPLPGCHIRRLRLTPDLEGGAVDFEIEGDGEAELVATLGGEIAGRWSGFAGRGRLQLEHAMPSLQGHTAEAERRLAAEWSEIVRRDRDHPSIVAWVAANESFGLGSIDPALRSKFLVRLYKLTHDLDGTRPVVSNDGWEHALTDLCTIHDYSEPSTLAARYRSVPSALDGSASGHPPYDPGYGYRGEPILVTEFGGLRVADSGGWGWLEVRDANEFVDSYRRLIEGLLDPGPIQGFCYTQLTDVQQEQNGLLTAERVPKVDPERIRSLTETPKRVL